MLTHPITADIVKAGSPSIGTDPNDKHIWYYNGTSAAQILVALDFVLPTYGSFKIPDLVITGPNPGWTLGPFVYTISGSIGASIVAIERGIPAIALSTGNTEKVAYNEISTAFQPGLQDPATITARLASALIQSFIDKAAGSPVLPKGYGVTVNMPYITSSTSDKCINPPFVLTRMSNSPGDKAQYNTQTGLFSIPPAPMNHGTTGQKNLPTERDVLASHCASSVTIFNVQHDASQDGFCINFGDETSEVPVVIQLNGTFPIDGSGLNTTVVIISNITTPQSPTADGPPRMVPTITGFGNKVASSMEALACGLLAVLAIL